MHGDPGLFRNLWLRVHHPVELVEIYGERKEEKEKHLSDKYLCLTDFLKKVQVYNIDSEISLGPTYVPFIPVHARVHEFVHSNSSVDVFLLTCQGSQAIQICTRIYMYTCVDLQRV